MDALGGAKAKLARADKHYIELKRFVDAFRTSHPYKIVERADPSTGDQLFVVDGSPVQPPLLPVVGDFLYDLRSALDNLAWQLVVRSGGTPSRRTAFPIFNDKDAWYHSAPKNMSGMSDTMQIRIAELQPCFLLHQFRKHWIWCLHEYNRIDKHQTLLLVNCSVDGAFWDGGTPRSVHRGPVSDGTILATFAAGQSQASFHSMPGIAFAEPPATGEDIIQLFLGMKSHVGRIVAQFEEEFFS